MSDDYVIQYAMSAHAWCTYKVCFRVLLYSRSVALLLSLVVYYKAQVLLSRVYKKGA